MLYLRELWCKHGGYTRYWVNVRDKTSPYNHSKVLKIIMTSPFSQIVETRIEFVNSAIFWHCGLRWFTLLPIKYLYVVDWVNIRGHGRPLKCVNRLFLSEFSYNASTVWSDVIVNKDRPVSQWMIIKMRYNVCVKHVVAVWRHWGYLERHITYN
jgi:hypothetical protein